MHTDKSTQTTSNPRTRDTDSPFCWRNEHARALTFGCGEEKRTGHQMCPAGLEGAAWCPTTATEEGSVLLFCNYIGKGSLSLPGQPWSSFPSKVQWQTPLFQSPALPRVTMGLVLSFPSSQNDLLSFALSCQSSGQALPHRQALK